MSMNKSSKMYSWPVGRGFLVGILEKFGDIICTRPCRVCMRSCQDRVISGELTPSWLVDLSVPVFLIISLFL